MIATFPNTTQSEQAEIRRIQVAGTKSVSMLLRAEALFELTFAVTAYHYLHGTWLIFAVLFLLPDVSMAGYLVDARIGAHAYNLIHTYVAPSFLALAGFVLAIPLLYSLALIWAAHIGFDRSLGYGLKYSVAFGATHLGWKGPPGSVIGSQP